MLTHAHREGQPFWKPQLVLALPLLLNAYGTTLLHRHPLQIVAQGNTIFTISDTMIACKATGA